MDPVDVEDQALEASRGRIRTIPALNNTHDRPRDERVQRSAPLHATIPTSRNTNTKHKCRKPETDRHKGGGRRSQSHAEAPQRSHITFSQRRPPTSTSHIEHRATVCTLTEATLAPSAPARDEQHKPDRNGPARRAPGRDHAGVLLLGTLHRCVVEERRHHSLSPGDSRTALTAPLFYRI